MTRKEQIERLKRVRYRAHNLPSPLREGAVDDLDAVIESLEAAPPERGTCPGCWGDRTIVVHGEGETWTAPCPYCAAPAAPAEPERGEERLRLLFVLQNELVDLLPEIGAASGLTAAVGLIREKLSAEPAAPADSTHAAPSTRLGRGTTIGDTVSAHPPSVGQSDQRVNPDVCECGHSYTRHFSVGSWPCRFGECDCGAYRPARAKGAREHDYG